MSLATTVARHASRPAPGPARDTAHSQPPTTARPSGLPHWAPPPRSAPAPIKRRHFGKLDAYLRRSPEAIGEKCQVALGPPDTARPAPGSVPFPASPPHMWLRSPLAYPPESCRIL